MIVLCDPILISRMIGFFSFHNCSEKFSCNELRLFSDLRVIHSFGNFVEMLSTCFYPFEGMKITAVISIQIETT